MTLACVRRPTCEARPAARKASDITYTPPWKYRTTWRSSIPSTVISAVGTPPSAFAVTVTSTGSGCADIASRSSRRCSLTSLPRGKADCRRTASRVSRCSVLMEVLLFRSVGFALGPLAQCQSGGGAVLGRGLAAAVSDAAEVSVDAANVVALFVECGSDRGLARSPEDRGAGSSSRCCHGVLLRLRDYSSN